MIGLVWLVLALAACELKVIVEYPGETGLDTGTDTGPDTGGDTEAEGASHDNF